METWAGWSVWVGNLGLDDRKSKFTRFGSQRPGVRIWLHHVPSVGSCELFSGFQFSSSGKWEYWCLMPSLLRADVKIVWVTFHLPPLLDPSSLFPALLCAWGDSSQWTAIPNSFALWPALGLSHW